MLRCCPPLRLHGTSTPMGLPCERLLLFGPKLKHSHAPDRDSRNINHNNNNNGTRNLHSPRASVSSEAAPSAHACTSKPTSVITRIHRDLESGAKSAVEVAEEYLQRIKQHDDTLHSFLFCNPHLVLEQASRVDEQLKGPMREEYLKSPLLGVPVAVKDNICLKGMPATAGSRILEGYNPPYDATAVLKLREEGGVFVGKTNMDEFGMGSTSEQSAFFATANPWANDRVPGGSSGGSGAAVAAGMCAVALGSDTGGSVRQPASFCGVVGLKPTYGRVSRFGLIAYASSLDAIGCMATSVEDSALLLNSMAGFDSSDSTSSREAVPDFAKDLRPSSSFSSKPLKGMRVGVIKETVAEGVEPGVVGAITKAVEHLESLGAEINEVCMPSFSLGLPAYYILAASEASSNLSRYDGLRFGLQRSSEDLSQLYCSSRGDGFGPEVKRRILMGTYALSAGYYDAYYKRAQKVRTLILKDFAKAMESNDVLVTPTAPTTAYKIGEKTRDPLSMYAGDLMTVNVNLAGLPALSVPCGLAQAADSSGVSLPVGLQLIGRSFREVDILKVGHIFEQTTDLWSPLRAL